MQGDYCCKCGSGRLLSLSVYVYFFPHSHEAIFEVAPEQRRLVTLHLPVLDRTPTQVFIQLSDIYGC